ncbi:hypothetical protein KZO01_08990 [Kurthia zopfii]|uniref:DUF8208 domain-containing protein n=1 Tax=Kurthia zopfii TaxID=1650 RepID=A0A8B4QDI7_9BACL|nr:hypothetical protein [Kurthia zopfii]PWI22720.1 hypothetical protein DF281_06000 [Kurthia zopfii]TDR39521.1 hypothetical protein DFR61_11147 [Kurthia zopfii]GEK30590.1 hypothetical protein KZO01_08990 [Kurthia zopfii]STX10830.1 Uncharacterised protein [Kurthia zopfii]
MSNEEIARKLEEFQEYLSISNIFTDIVRWLGWIFVKGFAWIVDMLESVTDDILLVKSFYNNPEIVAFVSSVKPFLYILLAFSLLYTGYLLIFQKKFNREGIAINLFIALMVILALNTGMDKADEFTDAAIDAVKVDSLYPNDDSTLSGSIIQRNIIDLTEVDKNNWSSTELEIPNSMPPSKVANINIREKYGKDTEGISNEGKDLSKHLLSFNNVGEYRAEKLDQSGLEWNNEYYFRYSVNWFTIFVTLSVIAFTLFSISLKLAKLFFELTFNYILALLIAPADIHDGQKTKKVIQSILNTFFATILIFLSMKVYMIGTVYLEEKLDNFPYLIALIAFSLAVVDGPNIVERLFGIDAGLKNGWGVLAGAYAGSKLASGAGKGLGSMVKGLSGKGSQSKNGKPRMANPLSNAKPASPNDTKKDEEEKRPDQEKTAHSQDYQSEVATNLIGDHSTPEHAKESKGIASRLESEQPYGTDKKQRIAPSPNDIDRNPTSRQHSGSAVEGYSPVVVSQNDNLANPTTDRNAKINLSARTNTTNQTQPVNKQEMSHPTSTQDSSSNKYAQTHQSSSTNRDLEVVNEAEPNTGTSRTSQAQVSSTHMESNQQHIQHTEQADLQTTQQVNQSSTMKDTTYETMPSKLRPNAYPIPKRPRA